MRTFLLTLRANRFESFAAAVYVLVALELAANVIGRLTSFGIPTDCFRDPGTSVVCQGLAPTMQDYLSVAAEWGLYALAAITLLPVLVGLIAGTALVAKEVDRGTTTFAWWLTGSRQRWLIARVLPVALFIVAAALTGGWLADQLEALRNPGVDPARSFGHLGLRGPVVGAEALAVFGLALACGAVLGRVLPALLVAAALSFGSIVGVGMLSDALLQPETVSVIADGGFPGQVDWRLIDTRVVAPDGSVMTWQEAYERYGDTGDPASPSGTGASELRTLIIAIPGDLYPIAMARMTVLYAALGLGAIVMAFAVVARRRP
jgi:hypothetical protein